MIETTNKKQELKKYQLLLDGPEKEFIDYGKIMAPNSKLIERENELGELIQQEQIADKNKTIVLSEKELRNELCKYNLAIVPMKNYKGDFDISYLKDVKNFMLEKNLSVSDYDLKDCMIAIYPKIHWRLLGTKDTVGTHIISTTTYMYNGILEKNPTILFKENTFYHLVHKGKNYKTLYNLRRGILCSNYVVNFFIRFISVVLFGLLLYNILPQYTILKFIAFFIYLIYNLFLTFFDSAQTKEQFNDEMYKK